MGRTIWKKAQQTQPRESIHKRVYRIIKEKMQISKRNRFHKAGTEGRDNRSFSIIPNDMIDERSNHVILI